MNYSPSLSLPVRTFAIVSGKSRELDDNPSVLPLAMAHCHQLLDACTSAYPRALPSRCPGLGYWPYAPPPSATLTRHPARPYPVNVRFWTH